MTAGVLRGLARAAVTAFYLATAVYCVLVAIPFTWIQFIQSDVVPAFTLFASVHRWLLLPAAAALIWVLAPKRRTPLQPLVDGVAGAVLLVSAAGAIWPVLAGLTPEKRPLMWAYIALAIPTVAWAVAALRPRDPNPPAAVVSYLRLVLASLAAAVYTWAVFAIAGRVTNAGELLASLVVHVAAFGAALAVIALAVELPAARSGRTGRGLLMIGLFATLGLAAVLMRLVFAALSWQGASAAAVSVAMALVIVLAFAGATPSEGTGVGRAAAAAAPSSRALLAVMLVALAFGAIVLVRMAVPLDWNFMFQRLIGLATGTLALAAFTRLLHRPIARRTSPHLWVTLWPLAAAPLAAMAVSAVPPTALDALAARHASFGAVSALAGGFSARTRDAAPDDGLFDFLQVHTSLPRSTPVDALDVQFADLDARDRSRPLPHIFIFVVDSLRPDYLSPYNAAATFTPRIGKFADDAFVFTRAFSHYGATGLSQPSIWIGGLLPHLQYIQPFAPMNALQKLVDAAGYQTAMSYDTISRSTVVKRPGMIDIDAGVANMDYDLCRSLTSLAGELAAAGGAPVFTYSQPQNIHVATLTRAGNQPIDTTDYGGMSAAIASRMARLDTCFGAFIDALKSKGLYDQSVIVLTSDHGDSLGEGGRQGHAYTIFPEILRIPMIVRVPEAFRAGLTADTSATAYSTDIAPTLYQLAGYEPEADMRFFGQPLFVRDRAERQEYADSRQLVASSYGPVYGVIDGGQRLYIIDAVNYREYLYDLGARLGDQREIPLDGDTRASYRAFVRERITALYDLYGVPPLR